MYAAGKMVGHSRIPATHYGPSGLSPSGFILRLGSADAHKTTRPSRHRLDLRLSLHDKSSLVMQSEKLMQPAQRTTVRLIRSGYVQISLMALGCIIFTVLGLLDCRSPRLPESRAKMMKTSALTVGLLAFVGGWSMFWIPHYHSGEAFSQTSLWMSSLVQVPIIVDAWILQEDWGPSARVLYMWLWTAASCYLLRQLQIRNRQEEVAIIEKDRQEVDLGEGSFETECKDDKTSNEP